MNDHVTINGNKFDPNRIDFTQKLNQKEVWKLKMSKIKWVV